MPDIHIHRRKGFIFGPAKVLSKREEDISGIYLLGVKYDASPNMQVFEFTVPNRNGSKYYRNRYEDKDIHVIVGIYAATVAQRRQMERELLSKIVGRKSRLVFLDEPNLFYEAECFEGIGVSENEIMTELDIVFRCSYCMYEFLGDANDIITADADFTTDELYLITNTQEWMNINTITYKMIENTGNKEATPFLTITANTVCNKIIVDNGINSFTLSNLAAGETIFIDNEKMIVYIKNGEQKISAMTRFSGKFLKVPVGESMIKINGISFDINIDFKFRNTYIV